MRLVELPEGIKIMFDVSIQKQMLEFSSEVVKVHDTFILTEPVISKGKIVGLSGENVSVGITYSRNMKSPIQWKGVAVTPVKQKGRILYKVTASGEGFEVNRREAFRLFVGIDGIAQIGANSGTSKVILKDVSETGFAIVFEKNIDDFMNKAVRLVFTDFDKSYTLQGFIIRKVMLDNGNIIYGCRISGSNALLKHYISQKQRQILSMHKNGSAYRVRQELEEALSAGAPIQKPDAEVDPNYRFDDIEKKERRRIFRR